MGKSTISMAMFNSYFDITRGYGFVMLKMSVLGAGHYGCRGLRSQIFGRTWGGFYGLAARHVRCQVFSWRCGIYPLVMSK